MLNVRLTRNLEGNYLLVFENIEDDNVEPFLVIPIETEDQIVMHIGELVLSFFQDTDFVNITQMFYVGDTYHHMLKHHEENPKFTEALSDHEIEAWKKLVARTEERKKKHG